MKLISFERGGKAGFGVVVGEDGVVDLGKALGGRYADLKSLLAADAIDEARELAGRSPDFALADVTLLPVIPNPGKIICVGLNYKTHVAETQRGDSEHPSLFIRFVDSLAAHGDTVLRPAFSERFDWEGELAFVVGQGGRHIPEAQAFEHIAGYCCFNDISVRDWQRHTHQFTPGKNFPGTGPLGPLLVTRDEVPDPGQLELWLTVNGEQRQRSSTRRMVYDVPRLIEYATSFYTLYPGDLIFSGTPEGVGPVKPGDEIRAGIERVGEFAIRVAPDYA